MIQNAIGAETSEDRGEGNNYDPICLLDIKFDA